MSNELYHHGVKGMKWGVRRQLNRDVISGAIRRKQRSNAEKGTAKLAEKAKTSIKKHVKGEMAQRGRAALDVLKNGDTDWMGNSISSDDVTTEARNRGKAALERLMYSQEQIDNKKFFGRYNF